MQIWLNGDFFPAANAQISIFDHGFLYGDGVYETLRSIEGRAFDTAAHWQRFKNSAELLQLPLPYAEAEVIAATNELLEKNGFSALKPGRLRWTLTRGNNHFEFRGAAVPTFLITTAPLEPYPSEYSSKGVAVTTLDVSRPLPAAKTIALLPMILGKQKAAVDGVFECLFLEQEYITEGTVSNFFIQVQNEIWTAPKERVLAGTSAQRFQEMLKKRGFKFCEKLFTPEEVLQNALAAFLTNSLFGVLPVTTLNKQSIGKGQVAEFFAAVEHDFWK